jgi:hypothetical protein
VTELNDPTLKAIRSRGTAVVKMGKRESRMLWLGLWTTEANRLIEKSTRK